MEEDGDQQLLTWPISTSLLERRRSCELTQKVLPCIEKAVSYLYDLEDKLIAAIEDDSEQRKSHESPSDQVQSWLLTKGPYDRRHRTVVSASGADLEVAGTGLKTSYGKGTESSLVKFGEQIVKDTLLLIGRLETDRVNTAQSLVKEKQRVAMLKSKITEYTHRRMHFMPIAVQREHEMCAINLQELNWYVAYKGRARDRSMLKFKSAEKINKALKDEIRYISEQRPLIEAKLEVEKTQMGMIEKEQSAADAELMGALAMLKSMEEKFARSDEKAENKREAYNKEVDEVRKLLNKDTEELSKYKMLYTSYVHSIKGAKERMCEMEEEATVLAARHERALELKAFHNEKVNALKRKIAEQAAEREKLIFENEKLKVEKDQRKSELEAANEILDIEVKKQTKKLKELVAIDRSLSRDIRSIRKSTNDCIKDKIESERTAKRAQMEMSRLKGEAELLKEELARLALVNDKLQVTLEREQEKCETIEEDLSTTAGSLKKQLRDESHARTVLQARLAADTSDLVKRKINANKKRDKSMKRAAEIEKAVLNIRQQVEKMEKAHAERKQVISELDALLEETQHRKEAAEKGTENKMEELTPREEDAKEKVTSLDKELTRIESRTDSIEKRMQDMSSSAIMMNRLLLSTQETIEELSDELGELTIQLHAGQGISETLENTLAQLRERSDKSAREHSEHMKKRDVKLQSYEVEIRQALDENTKLAKEYQAAQNHLMTVKNGLLQAYEIAILKQSNLKDRKELFDFRTRLHKALECYYKLRGAQTRAGILHFEQLAHDNGERLYEIESSLKDTLNQITEFMKVNNASHKAIRMQAEQVANGTVEVST